MTICHTWSSSAGNMSFSSRSSRRASVRLIIAAVALPVARVPCERGARARLPRLWCGTLCSLLADEARQAHRDAV